MGSWSKSFIHKHGKACVQLGRRENTTSKQLFFNSQQFFCLQDKISHLGP